MEQIPLHGDVMCSIGNMMTDETTLFMVIILQFINISGFPSGPVVKSLPCNAGDNSLITHQGRFHML